MKKEFHFMIILLACVLLVSAPPQGAQLVESGRLPRVERTVPLPAATLTLNTTFGGPDGNESCESLVQCADGGFCLVGWNQSQGESYPDVFVVRTDAAGNQLWNASFERSIGGFIFDVGAELLLCQDGGFAIIAQTTSPGYVDSDIWLIKLDSNGQHLWNHTYGTPKYSDHSLGFTECSDAGFAIAWGSMNGTLAEFYAGVIRTDSNGIQQWNVSYSGNHGFVDVVECSNGDLVLAGVVQAGPYPDAWLLRMDSSGQHLWNYTFGALDAHEQIEDFIMLSGGGFLLAGWYVDAIIGHPDALLICTDSSGTQLWNSSFGGLGWDLTYAVVECQTGGYALTGYSQSWIPGGLWLVRCGLDGTCLWNTTFLSGTTSVWGNGKAIIELANGGFVIGGYTGLQFAFPEDMWLVAAQDVRFLQEPTNQVIDLGSSFSYQLNATSLFGIDAWWTNDSSNFAVSGSGLVTNATALASGVFGLQVSFNDSDGNIISTTFSVMVIAPFVPPPIPGFPIEGIVVGVAAALGLGMVTRRKRRHH